MKTKHLTQTAMLLFCSVFLTACGGDRPKSASDKTDTEAKATTETVNPRGSSSKTEKAVNYLGATETINFAGEKYNLAWSHPPQGVYYIQEYMPDGQTIEQYEDIFILDLYKDANTTIKEAVTEKTNWLNNRKKTDPTANYKVMQNAGSDEYIVDLIISDGDIVEWNMIRYAEYKEDGKRAGIRTFTMSKRSYEGMEAFVNKMMKRKRELMKEFTQLPFPEIKL